MPERVESYDPEGVDYGWVMQMTFVVTIFLGAPVVTVLSLFTTLDTWFARAEFAVRVGAVIWLLTSVVLYVYAVRETDATREADTAGETDTDRETDAAREADATREADAVRKADATREADDEGT